MVAVVGTLVGLEIPLLLRVLKDQYEFKDLIARVLTVDYLGALVASLLFPIFLVPRLGIVRTGLLFGLLNALVALWSTHLLPRRSSRPARDLRLKALVVIVRCSSPASSAPNRLTLARRGGHVRRRDHLRAAPRPTSASSSRAGARASSSS